MHIRLTRRAAQLDRKSVQIRQNLALFLGIEGKFADAEAHRFRGLVCHRPSQIDV